MIDPTDLARLRRIWPAIVRAKGGWPPEPVGTVLPGDLFAVTDGRFAGCVGLPELHPSSYEVPDLNLPGTRAAVLAWLDLYTVRTYPDCGVLCFEDHTAATALAAIERWAKEHGLAP